jgi:hypothetical protein
MRPNAKYREYLELEVLSQRENKALPYEGFERLQADSNSESTEDQEAGSIRNQGHRAHNQPTPDNQCQ